LQIGPYSVVRQIGRGGMGTVYEVRHPEIPRSLALKVVRSDVLDEVTRQRFRREGEALAAISHPNVVSVHQLETIGQQLVLVTEFVEGTSLHELLREQGPLAPDQARQVLGGVASAICLLHEQGLIHRDLKPDNVLVRLDGTPVVIDFGLARHTREGSNLTQTGEILGTPSFMAPEQARDASRADEQSDVYALGGLLFACLAGHAPFQGATTLDTLDKVLHSEPEWPSGAESWPRPLRQLCEGALSKDPSERPPGAGAFLAALQSESASASRARVWGLGALLLVGALGAIGWSQLEGRAGSSPELSVSEAIRRGDAPLPSALPENEGAPELLRWRGVHQVLSGVPPEAVEEASGKTPGATALGAALAAVRGERLEVERLLSQHGQPRRVELRLLPALAAAHAGDMSRGDARLSLRLLEAKPELASFVELRGLRALAKRELAKADAQKAEGYEDDPSAPTWAREGLLLSSLRDPLDEGSLDRIGGAAEWVTEQRRAELEKRVGDLIRARAPHQNQERFGLDQIKLLTHAVTAYRRLAPVPAKVPKAEELIKFMLSSGVDVIAGSSAGRTAEEFDFALAIADAFPNQALVQSAAGQSLWSADLANAERWHRLLAVAWRELSLLDREEARQALGAQRARYRNQVRGRLMRILTGLQEALPLAQRDLEALQTARELADVLRDRDRNYDARSHAIDKLYIRYLEGKLTAEEVAGVPADWSTARLDLVRFAFMSPQEQRGAAEALFQALSYAKREVKVGILVHRATKDYLWPKGELSAKTGAQALSSVESAAKSLQGRHQGLSLHWWIQATRLAVARAPKRGKSRCKTLAVYARQAGWHDMADALTEAARDPRDEVLRELAARARPLPRKQDKGR
jgi:tRNA A-37 threonylcarbamoyl transferase component Bud32